MKTRLFLCKGCTSTTLFTISTTNEASSPKLKNSIAMDSKPNQLHFVLIPLMAQGHMIPVIDIAKLIAERGELVTVATTPHNASRFQSAIDEATKSGLQIHLLKIPFPSQQVGLPDGCENLDSLPSKHLLKNFYDALDLLQQPLESYLEQVKPPPSCIVSDKCLSWTSRTAEKFGIPRIVFHGMSCFSLLSAHNIRLHRAHVSVNSDSEPFLVPGMPQKFKITKAQLPGSFVSIADMDEVRNKMHQTESKAYGVVVNSFQELELGCADEYQHALNKKVWCIGPVSLCNKRNLDKFKRGNESSIDEKLCLEWLDSKKPNSVLYACLGSLCRLVPEQMIELALGLESSNKPFIFVAKTRNERCSELEQWLENENFQERIKGRGLIITGWAPQVLILSHPAIGGFLTHCGWNSTLEGICYGLPLITWPLFAEQFLNEKLVVEILRVGVRVGADVAVRWGDEEKIGVLVMKEAVEIAVNMVMEESDEAESRRNRAKELGAMARKSMEFGGSSDMNLSLLIEEIRKQSKID